jgi:tRNA threonylcarbamoyladenosine modification (KEOPS) complex Cgi121 subunit
LGVALSAEAKLAPEEAERELLRLRSSHTGLVIQLVSMKRLPSAEAVLMIAAQTLRALDTDSLLAAKPEVDLLLRLAGTSQITVALKKNGYRSGGTMMLVAAGPEKELGRLEREISKVGPYRLREAGEMDEESRDMVEIAALLGTRI